MPKINVPMADISALKQWQSGTNETNGEVILVLELHGKPTVIVQMPHVAAREISDALAKAAKDAAPKKVN